MTAKSDIQLIVDATRAPPAPTNPAIRRYMQVCTNVLRILSITPGHTTGATEELADS